jgi:hypothetical protein
VKNEEILHGVRKKKKNILHTIKERKSNWIEWKLSSKTRYSRKDKRMVRSDGKKRKTKLAAMDGLKEKRGYWN